MQGILDSARAAFTFVLVLVIGWGIVFLAGALVGRKLQRNPSSTSLWASFTWVWDNANIIGIPTLLLGTVYLVWAMYYGPGLGGPSLLVLLLMAAAALLIGFAPSLRRR